MNKSDLKLLLFCLIVTTTLLLIINQNKQNGSYAKVYYLDKEILKIDLSIDNIYDVEGYNGNVKIVVSGGKVKVDSENSPLHLCSKQGYISKSNQMIVCLPNKLIIKIDNDELDGVVG